MQASEPPYWPDGVKIPDKRDLILLTREGYKEINPGIDGEIHPNGTSLVISSFLDFIKNDCYYFIASSYISFYTDRKGETQFRKMYSISDIPWTEEDLGAVGNRERILEVLKKSPVARNLKVGPSHPALLEYFNTVRLYSQ